MKNGFGLKGVRESLSEGNEVILKICHICYIKIEKGPLKFKSFREKLLVAKQS